MSKKTQKTLLREFVAGTDLSYTVGLLRVSKHLLLRLPTRGCKPPRVAAVKTDIGIFIFQTATPPRVLKLLHIVCDRAHVPTDLVDGYYEAPSYEAHPERYDPDAFIERINRGRIKRSLSEVLPSLMSYSFGAALRETGYAQAGTLAKGRLRASESFKDLRREGDKFPLAHPSDAEAGILEGIIKVQRTMTTRYFTRGKTVGEILKELSTYSEEPSWIRGLLIARMQGQEGA